tara:strand:+ start:815 stop:1387 length:573 start_codon:yes stop_codon:yes gene_type:complete
MDLFMLSQSYTDRYFIHKIILRNAILKAGAFVISVMLISGCATNLNQSNGLKIDKDFLNQSFILSGSISIQSKDGNFIGSYKLTNGLEEAFHIKDILGREVFSLNPLMTDDMIGEIDQEYIEVYRYFQDWRSFSSILLAIDVNDDLKSNQEFSITYSGHRDMQNFSIPKTISVIGPDYELTFTIKSLKII